MEHSEKTELLYNRYHRRLQKKMKNKPKPVQVIMERTFSSAVWILELLDGISFTDLTMGVYFLCKDVEFREVVRLYDAQLELAGANPEKFIFGLHAFYNDVTNKIRKENKFQEFAEFLGMVMRINEGKKATINPNIVNAYLNLILQTLEYIRPNKFDLNTCVYGVSTSGELLTGAYPYAFSDLPGIELRTAIENGKKFKSQAELHKFIVDSYESNGICVRSPDDLERLEMAQRVHVNTATALLPFINEYTFDIAPTTPFDSLDAPLLFLTVPTIDDESLKERLRHRRRTLPQNGIQFIFEDQTNELKSLLFKEVLHFNSIHLLYRLDTGAGGLSGYYDTASGFHYSIVREANLQVYYHRLTLLILYLYASQVLDDYPLLSFSEQFKQAGIPLRVKAYGHAGKLLDVYHKPIVAKGMPQQLDESQYTHKAKEINGFIKRLPEGQTASEEARALAEQYGYDLALNETYVRPFIKQVFIRKDTLEKQKSVGE